MKPEEKPEIRHIVQGHSIWLSETISTEKQQAIIEFCKNILSVPKLSCE